MEAIRSIHGLSNTPTHRAWINMRQRCFNTNHPQYKDYGGRGITACLAWDSFEVFLADMGLRPDGLTLERCDNNLGYSKDNCYWATRDVQGQNRSVSKLSHDSVKFIRSSNLPTSILMKQFGVSHTTINRARRGVAWK
jgi:hypothetical protein